MNLFLLISQKQIPLGSFILKGKVNTEEIKYSYDAEIKETNAARKV